jgi:16S rRNA (guanine527-N7)-methyltransferase
MKLSAAEKVHRDLLDRWREAMNLVGPGPVGPHFIDSAGAVDGLAAEGRWADLGSGAGFPGIALAARHPKARVLLVESRHKRVVFLRNVLQAAGLQNAQVFHGRVEDLEPGFDGVISRAFRPPEDYLEDAARLLVSGGRAVVLSGNEPPEFDGWRRLESTAYPVPDGTRTRTILVRG